LRIRRGRLLGNKCRRITSLWRNWFGAKAPDFRQQRFAASAPTGAQQPAHHSRAHDDTGDRFVLVAANSSEAAVAIHVCFRWFGGGKRAWPYKQTTGFHSRIKRVRRIRDSEHTVRRAATNSQWETSMSGERRRSQGGDRMLSRTSIDKRLGQRCQVARLSQRAGGKRRSASLYQGRWAGRQRHRKLESRPRLPRW